MGLGIYRDCQGAGTYVFLFRSEKRYLLDAFDADFLVVLE